MNLFMLSVYRDMLNRLHTAWSDVQLSNSLQTVFIQGASGLRKSQLVREFLAESQALVLSTRGTRIPGTYFPLQYACEQLLQLQPVQEQVTRQREEVASTWHSFLSAFASIRPFLPKHPGWTLLERWQTVPQNPAHQALQPATATTDDFLNIRSASLPERFSLILEELTRLHPIVLFIDDLDLVDEPTRDALFKEILPKLKTSPLLFIAILREPDPIYGDDGIHSTFFDPVTRWLPNATLLKVNHLTENDIQSLLVQTVITADSSQLAELSVQIYRATQGKTAFVQDVIDWLIPRVQEGQREHVNHIPDSAQLMQTAFEQMPDTHKRVLQMAALQGKHFCFSAVAHALSMPEQELLALEQDAQTNVRKWFQAMIRTNTESGVIYWCDFKNSLLQEIAYTSIPSESRPLFSQRIALALEAVYPIDRSAIAGLLCEQFEQAGMKVRAAFYQAIAAQQENNKENFVQGLRYASDGRKNLEQEEHLHGLLSLTELQVLKSRLLLEQGRALRATGQSPQAIDILGEALEIAQSINDVTLLVDASLYRGIALFDINQWDEGIMCMRQALMGAMAKKNWFVITEVMERLRERYYKRGKYQEFLEMCDEVIAELGQFNAPEAQITCIEILEDKGWIYYESRDLQKALDVLRMALVALTQVENHVAYPAIHYKIYVWITRTLEVSSAYEQALREADVAVDWASATHVRRNEAYARQIRARILRYLGRIAEAEKEFQESIELCRNASDMSILGELEEGYGNFLSDTGRKKDAREMYQLAYKHHASAGNFYRAQMAKNNVASMEKHLGSFEDALATYNQLYREGIAQDDKNRQSLSLNHIGDIYRILNRIAESKQMHEKALQLCEDMERKNRKAITLRYLGQAYLVNRQIEAAEKMLRYSDQLYQEHMDDKVRWYHTRIFLGRLALCQGDSASAQREFTDAINALRDVEDLPWIGLGYVNQGLAYLVQGDGFAALKTTTMAQEIFAATNSWRTSEAWHLLARCYLAVTDLPAARAAIATARTAFIRFRLFHRIPQVETIAAHAEDVEASDNHSWQFLSQEELRFDYNHLGV